MNAFAKGQSVEEEGFRRLSPYFSEVSNGVWLRVQGSATARALQPIWGDVFLMSPKGALAAAEVKIEGRHTGNLFLETWSNRNLTDEESWVLLGQNPGWMQKTRADFLVYFFLDSGDLYVLRTFNLVVWANSPSRIHWSKGSRIHDFKEIPQRKLQQKNDTWGRLVPVEVLKEEVGLTHRVLPAERLVA